MKMKLTLIIMTLITLITITSCAKFQGNMEVYSFSGENESIAINNGLIIITGESEKFVGGDISFKENQPLEVMDYFEKFYFYKEGNEVTILSNSTITEGTTQGLQITSDLGSISSKELFYDNDLELVKDSLNFSISGKLINGEKFEYELIVVVEKVY